MFGKRRPLQSRSEVILRNSVVTYLLVFNILFLVIPIGIAFVGSFHRWNPLNGVFEFLGMQNYTEVLTSSLFWKSMWNTVIFCAVVIFFRVFLGLALAYAVNSNLIQKKSFFRTIFYMPTVTPLVAVAFVWKFMFNPQFGMINQITGLDINWLYDTRFALPAVMLMTVWKDFGYAVVLFIAGLCAVPSDCIEAAEIDGANKFQVFKNITLPLLRPTMVLVVITSMISYLQAYVQVMVMTEGGPGTSTYLSSYLIFDEAFVKYNFGSASAMAFILFIFTALLTLASFRVSGTEN